MNTDTQGIRDLGRAWGNCSPAQAIWTSGFQQIPLEGAQNLPSLEEHCSEPADSSLQCGAIWQQCVSTWGNLCVWMGV